MTYVLLKFGSRRANGLASSVELVVIVICLLDSDRSLTCIHRTDGPRAFSVGMLFLIFPAPYQSVASTHNKIPPRLATLINKTLSCCKTFYG